MKLVIARHLFHQRAAAVILEHDEVTNECQEAAGIKDALDHHLQLRNVRVGQRLPRDGAPGLEPFSPGGQGADTGIEPVRDHERGVEGKQRGDFDLVGLQLLPRGPDGGLFIDRVLQLDDRLRQAVDEQHHVRTAFVPVFHDSELAHREPVVVCRVVEVDDVDLVAAHHAARVAVLDIHTVHDHTVEGAVAGFQGGSLRAGQLAKGVVQGVSGKVGVEAGQGIAQPLRQDNVAVIAASGAQCTRGDIGATYDAPAKVRQPRQGGRLNGGFSERHPLHRHRRPNHRLGMNSSKAFNPCIHCPAVLPKILLVTNGDSSPIALIDSRSSCRTRFLLSCWYTYAPEIVQYQSSDDSLTTWWA